MTSARVRSINVTRHQQENGRSGNVRFTPAGGHVQCTSSCLLWANSGHRADSFDHLIGASEQRGRDCEAERFGSLEVDNQLVFGRRLDRHVGWLLALEDAIDVAGSLPVNADWVWRSDHRLW